MHHKNPNRWQKIHESIHYPAQKEKKIQQVEPVFPEHPSAIREDARERINFTDFFYLKLDRNRLLRFCVVILPEKGLKT